MKASCKVSIELKDGDIDSGNKEDYSEYDILSISKEQSLPFARLFSSQERDA